MRFASQRKSERSLRAAVYSDPTPQRRRSRGRLIVTPPLRLLRSLVPHARPITVHQPLHHSLFGPHIAPAAAQMMTDCRPTTAMLLYSPLLPRIAACPTPVRQRCAIAD